MRLSFNEVVLLAAVSKTTTFFRRQKKRAWRSPKAIIFDCQKSTISSVNSLAVRGRTASVVCLELDDFCLVKNAKRRSEQIF